MELKEISAIAQRGIHEGLLLGDEQGRSSDAKPLAF
jgi:hypothetical protein